MPTDERTLISTEEVAKLLGVDETTVQRRARAGHIPAHKMPGLRGAYIFERAVIEQLIDAA
jgi:excisionase family DNA binding protein